MYRVISLSLLEKLPTTRFVIKITLHADLRLVYLIMTKFIFVTGGVISGLGKGTVAASIAKLLQFRGLSVSLIKCDPYLNVDAGTMNPLEHGENFVCEKIWEFKPAKGFLFRIAEVDQDFGIYERFTGEIVHPSHNITSGQIYLSVILRERVGEYLGKTIQIIPHVTDEIINRIFMVAKENKDIVITEIGGTIGDIESMPYLEAIRQLRARLSPGDTFLIHVTYVPYLSTIKQLKTKPTQHSVQKLREYGLYPDCVVARSEFPLTKYERDKIALFSGLPPEAVISAPNIESVYALPIVFEQQGLGDYIIRKLNLSIGKGEEKYKERVRAWENVVLKFFNTKYEVKIALVGKYTKIVDSYISIIESLRHAGAELSTKVDISLIDASEIDLSILEEFDGILLTPGFGKRAAEGMISAAGYALNKKIPFLGICFGAQLATVAFAREFMGWKNANSTEIDKETPYPVVDLLEEQRGIDEKGGTMRLGGLAVLIKRNTKLWNAYKKEKVVERFRHRYHIIRRYAMQMKKKGFIINAEDADKNIAGFEISWHPFFIGVQFHPEFKSRPWNPSPVYLEFVRTVLELKR